MLAIDTKIFQFIGALYIVYIGVHRRHALTEDNKLLSADSEECQYLVKTVEYCGSQSTNGNAKYQVLVDIVKQHIHRDVQQQVRPTNC